MSEQTKTPSISNEARKAADLVLKTEEDSKLGRPYLEHAYYVQLAINSATDQLRTANAALEKELETEKGNYQTQYMLTLDLRRQLGNESALTTELSLTNAVLRSALETITNTGTGDDIANKCQVIAFNALDSTTQPSAGLAQPHAIVEGRG